MKKALYKCEAEAIQWTGKNTKEIVSFCCDNTDLCGIHNIGVDGTLQIEPADTMRHGSVYIPLDGYAIKMKSNSYGGNYIQGYCEDVFNANFDILRKSTREKTNE